MKLIALLALIVSVHADYGRRSVVCEFENKESEYVKHNYFLTCGTTTPIRSDRFKFVVFNHWQESHTEAMDFQHNKELLYLPYNASHVFPGVIEYKAAYCKLQRLHRDNFSGLHKLKALHLGHNELQAIDDDVFEGLLSLEFLSLAGNRIQIMSGSVVKDLAKLKILNMKQNNCISRSLNDNTATMAETLNLNCAGSAENRQLIEEFSRDEIKSLKHELMVCGSERDSLRG